MKINTKYGEETLVNPEERGLYDKAYRIAIPWGPWAIRFIAWGDSLMQALETTTWWIVDNVPDQFLVTVDLDLNEAAEDIDAPANWRDNKHWHARVVKAAESDLTSTEAGYVDPGWQGHEVADPAALLHGQLQPEDWDSAWSKVVDEMSVDELLNVPGVHDCLMEDNTVYNDVLKAAVAHRFGDT